MASKISKRLRLEMARMRKEEKKARFLEGFPIHRATFCVIGARVLAFVVDANATREPNHIASLCCKHAEFPFVA
jgi:hypothetical protein